MANVLADMHVPPAARTWGARIGLSIVVAIVIGYLPGHVLRRDARTVKLEAQIGELDTEAKALEAQHARLVREIEAVRSDVGAIEDRARADLGMVYADEIVLNIAPTPSEPSGENVPKR